MLEIHEADEVNEELVEAMARLVPQLSNSNPAPGPAELAEIVEDDTVRLLIARNERGIVGTLTLVHFRIPTGVRAWIEDVIVDEAARGSGVGRKLNEAAIELALAAGAVSIDLTSRPSREDANRLYRKLGFEQRQTNVYRFSP